MTEKGKLPITYEIILYVISQPSSCFDSGTISIYRSYISGVLDTNISNFSHPLRSVELDR